MGQDTKFYLFLVVGFCLAASAIAGGFYVLSERQHQILPNNISSNDLTINPEYIPKGIISNFTVNVTYNNGSIKTRNTPLYDWGRPDVFLFINVSGCQEMGVKEISVWRVP